MERAKLNIKLVQNSNITDTTNKNGYWIHSNVVHKASLETQISSDLEASGAIWKHIDFNPI